MLRLLRQIAIASPSDSFPYDIGEPYTSAWGTWTHYRGTSKDDGTPVSIFSLSGIDANSVHLVSGRNGAKLLRTVKHPNIVSFLFSTEVEVEHSDSLSSTLTIYIVTEAVVPLPEKIKELGLKGQERDLYFSSGLHQIATAVSFLNDDCKLVHGNVCLSSVVVDKNLDWKLNAFDLMFKIDGSNETSTAAVLHYERLVAPQYKPTNVLKLEKATVKDPWAIDSWGLGCFIYELFSGMDLSTQEELHQTDSIPVSLVPDYENLLSRTPSSRLKASTFVEESNYFQNELVSTRCFLETLVVKDRAQRDEFFESLPNLAGHLPASILRYKILPLVGSYLEYDSSALGAQQKIQSMLASATTDSLEKRAEDPAPLVQGFQSAAGPGQVGSADHISGQRLNEPPPEIEDHDMEEVPHLLEDIIKDLKAENLSLVNELDVLRRQLPQWVNYPGESVESLKNKITDLQLSLQLSQLGRKAAVEKIEEKLETLRQQRRGSDTNPICRWIPPPLLILKMNVDASIFQNKRGGGAVIRDSTGLFIRGLSFPIPVDVAEEIIAVELAAAWFAVEKVGEWGFRNLIIESDSLNLVQELDRRIKESEREGTAPVISMVSHCGKASNNLAQHLAQMGGLVVGNDFDKWTTVCPAALYQYWALDLPQGSVRSVERQED